MTRPRLALVSTGIRRDLLAPLRHLRRFELVHFYRRAEYGDLTPDDFDATLHPFHSPLALYRGLVAARPAVIQGVDPFSFALLPDLWACLLAARRTGAALVAVTLQNRPLDLKFGRLPAAALRLLVRPFFASACLVVAVNAGARRNLLAAGVPPSRIVNLLWGTWGVDLDEFSPQAAALPGKASPSPTLLFAGRLHPEKGIFVLLDALQRLRLTVPAAHLLLAGDGPARVEFESRAAGLGLTDAITLLGTVKNRAMPALLRSVTLLALPSLTNRKWEEQVGMVALQALACGVPVVAFNSGAIPEFVPDGKIGLLAPEGDVAALSEAFSRVLQDRELYLRLSRAAREYACAHYDARANIERAETILQERCLAGRL